MEKRLLSVLLTICMLLALLPVSVLADGDFTIENGALTKYNGSGGNVTVPNSVTSIWSYAFEDCTSLKSVTIPSSVTSIGDWVFKGCSGLTSVTIPSSVTSIGSGVFSDCTSLTSASIPSGVTSIENHAFNGCTSLTSVTIPNSVTSIGGGVFSGCTSLTKVTIPSSVTSIGYNAFSSCKSLTSVTIPNSVTSIGNSVFSFCNNLTSVTLSSGIASIGNYAFEDCTSLKSVTIPSSVTSIGDYAFHGCSGLTSVTIPSSVTSIGNNAFSGCTSLTSVMIPNSVTSIGDWAFFDSGLTGVTIPSSVSNIGDGAFESCNWLTDVYYSGSETQWKAIDIGNENERLTNAKIHYGTAGPEVPSNNAVIYDLSGGVGNMPAECWDAGQTVTVFTTAPTKSGYTFKGWSNGSTTYQPGDTFIMPDHEVTLTAVWEINATQYYLTYNQGGVGPYPATSHLAGETINIPSDIPVKEGYKFRGWSDGSATYQAGDSFTMPNRNVTLTAVWEAPSLSYHLNGGRGDVPGSVCIDVGSSTVIESKIPEKDGYTFVCWSDDRMSYQPGDTIIMPSRDVVLKAEWQGLPRTLRYNLDGGTGSVPSEEQHRVGDIVSITSMSPEKRGFVFAGWSDGSNTYWRGATFTMPNNNVTLTAQWTDDPAKWPINQGDVFVKQETGKTCTLATATMMVRRRAILDGIDDWNSITETNMRNVAWKDGTGFIEEFTYRGITGGTESIRNKSTQDKKEYLISLLREHPEGIGVYSYISSKQRHAVLLTDYDAATDTFYCADPSNATAHGRIPLNQCSITWGGSGQTGILSVLHRIYYVAKDAHRKTLVSSQISSHCPVEMIFSIDGIVLDSRTNTGTLTNSMASMTVSGTKDDRNIEVQIKGDYVNSHDIDIKLVGTNTGEMTFTVEHLFSDGSTEKNIFKRVPITKEFIAEAIGCYSQSSVVLSISESSEESIWVANPNETATTPYVSHDNLSDDDVAVIPTTSISSHTPTYHIESLTDIVGGTVKVMPTSASKNQSVTITAKPDYGYMLVKLTVTDSNGTEITLTDKGSNEFTFIMPNSAVAVNAVFSTTQTANPFTDVAESAWYYSAVKFVSENGLMNGVGNNLFAPDAKLSRAMLAQILYNREGKPSVNSSSVFSDVATDAWYADAVTWASGQSVVTGYGNGLFGPNDNITREQFVVMLYRYAGSPVPADSPLNFTDADKVSAWAQDAMRWAVEQGIINGKGNGILDPTGNATRAEAAQMLKNYLEKQPQ